MNGVQTCPLSISEYSTTLKTLVGGDYIEVGGVSVYRFDDGFHFNVTEYTECYEILEIKAWVGNELTDLASIQANPDMFPDRYVETIYDGSYNIVVPYDESWTCENSIYTAVFAKVRNTCNSGSGEETTVAIAGEEILWAGKKINAGKVIYKVENGYLELTYSLLPGWELMDAHLMATDGLDKVPKAGNGQPVPGKFTYSHESSYFNDNTFTIPVSQITSSCNIPLFIVAHAALKNLKTGASETAFAGGMKFDSPRWAYYFSFDLSCGSNENFVYDAWADGNSFSDNGIADKWGWFFGFLYSCQ